MNGPPGCVTVGRCRLTVPGMRRLCVLLVSSVAVSMAVVAPVSPAAAVSGLAVPAPTGSQDPGDEPAAIEFERLDGFEGRTVPLRVRLPAAVSSVVLRDGYGNVVPFTGEESSSAVRLPALLAGNYELQVRVAAGLRIARFHVTGIGEVPPDPGPNVAGRAGPGTTTALLVALFVALAGVGVLVAAGRKRVAAVFAVLVAATAVAGGLRVSAANVVPSLEECRRAFADPSQELLDCSVRRAIQLTNDGRFPEALAELDAAGISTCHEVAHIVGVRAWLTSTDPVREILRPGYDLCNHAFYHGALYGAAIYMSDEEFLDSVLDACEAIHPGDHPAAGACAHGVGHSLMLRFGDDLPRADRACLVMRTDSAHRRLECRGAALMEYAVIHQRSGGDATRLPFPGRPPAELCDEAAPELRVYCYGGLAMAKPRTETSARELLEYCAALPADRGLPCVEGVVPEFRSHLGRPNLDGSVCTVLDASLREVCARQYAYFIYDQFPDASLVLRICDEAGVDPDVCMNAGSEARDWDRDTGE